MAAGTSKPPTLARLRREIRAAKLRIQSLAVETPVERSEPLSKRTGAAVFLKHEQVQHTGSFKYRGALNRLLGLKPSERRRGVVAASSGNHGLAVATALSRLRLPGTVVLPRDASRTKVAAIRTHAVEVRRHGQDCVESELFARRLAERTDRVFVSPYNDLQVVAGQGTLGSELNSQIRRLDTVFVAVGGGGLISGIAAELKRSRRQIRIIGCQPARSAVMSESVAAGRIVDLPSRETLSDGTAGGIEAGAMTFDFCRRLVDQWILVSEREIAAAMRLLVNEHQVIVEGAAGVAVAALLKARSELSGRTAAAVLCGRNVSTEVLRRVLC